MTETTEDFSSIARAMKELGLQRDLPYAEKPAPDFHQELNAKLQPKPVVDDGYFVDDGYYGC